MDFLRIRSELIGEPPLHVVIPDASNRTAANLDSSTLHVYVVAESADAGAPADLLSSWPWEDPADGSSAAHFDGVAIYYPLLTGARSLMRCTAYW